MSDDAGSNRRADIVADYVFFAWIIGRRAALHRVADAYGVQLKTVLRYLCDVGVLLPDGEAVA